ncbi:DNA methyltransferase [Photorhabdus luminescens]|uniref:Methyltransferase n=1 Tax=Photorhabdus luminescens subsp. mexicana TaxID=2100167 RepID=A0A4R4JGI6_PHOLU|nr:DNA methyltransferase [Photorhabdus luminescens]TDB53043.1 hypothetical protein C5468_08935 [Photorhabdus luminescens subsp. mexicana]
MAKIELTCGKAEDHSLSADLILTDPQFDMEGKKLRTIIDNQQCNHLVLITTMRQLLDFMSAPGWELSFDFVLDAVAPKKSRNLSQPNYTHQTGVYLYRTGEKSLFNRKLRQRSDVFEANGYWPTIFHAPRERMQEHGMAKNADAITDLLGSFNNISSVADPFAGSGTTAIAAFELDIDCKLIEFDEKYCRDIIKIFSFMGAKLTTHGLNI